jgi:hypothetical protein
MTHIFDEFSIDQEADSITPPMRTAGRVAYQKFFEETDVVGVRAIDAAVQAIYAAMEAARPRTDRNRDSEDRRLCQRFHLRWPRFGRG